MNAKDAKKGGFCFAAFAAFAFHRRRQLLGHAPAAIVTMLAAAAVLGVVSIALPAAQSSIQVLVQTGLGDIVLEIDTGHAPNTAANFLRYVDAGHYDGGTFHRTVKMDNQPDSPVKIEVIQAGVSAERTRDGFPAIPLERTSVTGLRHTDGTISMARGQPDSATSGWFICINDQPSLDFGGARNPDGQGFAAFGRVVRGMDVARKIQQAPHTDAQRLTPPITILKATRIQ
jgi:peptidyl-prolyl cis-trans isomerase A (cyclophilin A)